MFLFISSSHSHTRNMIFSLLTNINNFVVNFVKKRFTVCCKQKDWGFRLLLSEPFFYLSARSFKARSYTNAYWIWSKLISFIRFLNSLVRKDDIVLLLVKKLCIEPCLFSKFDQLIFVAKLKLNWEQCVLRDKRFYCYNNSFSYMMIVTSKPV